MLKLKRVRFSDLEHDVFLKEKGGMPDVYSTLLNAIKLHSTNIQASAIENHLAYLKWLLEWGKSIYTLKVR